jgi:hypothetical protein
VPESLGDDDAGSGVSSEYRMDSTKRCHRVKEIEHEENEVVGWPENSSSRTNYAAERVVKDLLKSS